MGGIDYDFMKLYRENERIALFPKFVRRIDAEIADKYRDDRKGTKRDEKKSRRAL